MNYKQIITVILFLLFGITVSVATKKPLYYIPTSLVVGVMVALFVLRKEKS